MHISTLAALSFGLPGSLARFDGWLTRVAVVDLVCVFLSVFVCSAASLSVCSALACLVDSVSFTTRLSGDERCRNVAAVFVCITFLPWFAARTRRFAIGGESARRIFVGARRLRIDGVSL